ncbi:MAG: AmmeMemoRadiSam system protein B [Bacteroidales bacterium]
MNSLAKITLMTSCLIFMELSCQSQEKSKTMCNQNRQPAYAGQFYEANPTKLSNELDEYFRKAVPPAKEKVLAIITPHAGYVYSGQVAADAFNQLDPKADYKKIFILAPSHHFAIDGAALYCKGNYITPLGQVDVDCELSNQLVKNNKVFQDLPEVHQGEHAIEVELPFLQKRIKTGYKIIPVIIGTQDPVILKKIAGALKPYLTHENLFVISSDFSHYPSYNDAINCDKASASAILKNSPEELQNQLVINENKHVKNLVTSMCGEAGIMCLLYMTHDMLNVEYKLIDYKNSGDSGIGDKSRVVGYCAISLVQKSFSDSNKSGFELDESDKTRLLYIARKTLEDFIRNGIEYQPETESLSENIKAKCGAFVTLTIKGQLRGCIGSFSTEIPLYKVVHEMAIAASSEDPRFQKVKVSELDEIEIEISVLTPMKKIESIKQIEIGKHGIYIKNGYKSGTLLPQVAPGNNWNAEEFVKYCALYKAGIAEEEIKNSELFVYEAIVFHEKKKEK